MGLKIKSLFDVFNNLIEWITAKTDKITDFNVGSAIRTLLEAIAVQFEEFYFSLKQNVLYAIENAVYDSFGFDLKISQYAEGYVTVDFDVPLPSAMVFAKGTLFTTSGLYGYLHFESTDDVFAQRGTIAIPIPVICKTIGTVGNIPAKAINTLVASNSIIVGVHNDEPFTNGTDEETSVERKKRFQHYIKTLARGTRDAIIYGCLDVDGVAGAWVDDNYIGYVKLYAHNSDGELPPDLRSAILKNLENYRSGGIEVEVLPIVKKPLNLSILVMLDDNYDTSTYNELIKTLITQHLNEYSVSDDFYIANIIHAVKLAYEEIVVNITIRDTHDLQVYDNELVRAGKINVECINVKNWRE